MPDKKAFVLRISPETLRQIEQWAADEFRSTNGQIEFLLQRALNERKRGARKTKSTGDGED
ncbi:MAG: Arc family DNA binding domain-containing protein [Mucilaginibacter polytrichastri]|nr:Arc family DNA binding domain-containing protein [Mucilaginibacter polytrichastri]